MHAVPYSGALPGLAGGRKPLTQFELMRWRFTDGNINSSACCDHRDFALLQISRGSATQAIHKDGGKDNQPQHNFLGVALDVQEIHAILDHRDNECPDQSA